MEFIKKNKFFIVLCTTFILIIAGLFSYRLARDYEPPKPVDPGTDTPIEQPSQDPNIASFTGEYNRKDAQVDLKWSIDSKDKYVSSAKLYLIKNADTKDEKDSYLADVKNTSAYSMPQSAYEFPTGKNIFKLKVTFSDGTQVEAKVNVNVSLILSTSQSIKVDKENNSADVTLTYVYGKSNPVEIPSIRVFGTTPFTDADITIGGTETSEEDGFVTAKTTYHFVWRGEKVPESFTTRWYFNQIGQNYDYITDFTK